MAVAYSNDRCYKIVSAYFNGCGTIAELAILFNVCMYVHERLKNT
jgi:hypothetical protein